MRSPDRGHTLRTRTSGLLSPVRTPTVATALKCARRSKRSKKSSRNLSSTLIARSLSRNISRGLCFTCNASSTSGALACSHLSIRNSRGLFMMMATYAPVVALLNGISSQTNWFILLMTLFKRSQTSTASSSRVTSYLSKSTKPTSRSTTPTSRLTSEDKSSPRLSRLWLTPSAQPIKLLRPVATCNIIRLKYSGSILCSMKISKSSWLRWIRTPV